MIVLDDIGFAQLGCFGAGIDTPNIDRVAAGGLRYNRFHVTSVCSATRAALLTGRNHHAVGMGVTEEARARLPRLHRPDPAIGGHRWRGCSATRATTRWRSASGT